MPFQFAPPELKPEVIVGQLFLYGYATETFPRNSQRRFAILTNNRKNLQRIIIQSQDRDVIALLSERIESRSDVGIPPCEVFSIEQGLPFFLGKTIVYDNQ